MILLTACNVNRVGNALEVHVRNQELRTTINRAIHVIDSVYGDGTLMKTPMLGRAPSGGVLDSFTYYLSEKNH